MPTNRQIIEQMVDEKIQRGLIAPALRDQQINTLAGNEEMAAAWAADLLRASDYTNKTKQFAEERRQASQQIEADRQRVQTERQRLQDWERTVQGQIAEANRIQADQTRLAAKAAAYEQTLRDYNMLGYVSVPEDEPVRTQPVTHPTNPVNPPNQPSQYLSRDEANNAMQGMLQMSGKMMRIAGRHQQLFGAPLEEDLYSHYLTTGEDPERYWETKYAVAAKQSEIQAKQREAEIAKIREEERTKLMGELTMDPSRVVGAPQGVFGQNRNPVMEQYAHSRALEHAQNGANLDAATGTEKWVAPEMKPEIAMMRERVDRAKDMFVKNFDINGNPISEQGRQFTNKYGS